MIARRTTHSPPDAGADADEQTWRPYEELAAAVPRALLLTLLYHPQLGRIGEVARLRGHGEDRACALSRSEPVFRGADGLLRAPLTDRHISRTPLLLLPEADGGLLLHGPGLAVAVEGRPLTGPRRLSPRELEEGVMLRLAGRVLIWLQYEVEAPRVALAQHDLVGESAAVHELRAEVLHVAGLGLPVLLRGESGAGKEQVARALHAASPRAGRPYVALNLAALNPQTAVAELLGHRRGAFTGATRAHEGYFREADGGTIFLDEIADAPLDVQAALLRVLETGEVQPVGGGGGVRVDVRVIAATEVDLEAAVQAGSFRLSLLYRLAGYEIWLPPLRSRRADIPRLLMHLIRAELRRGGGEEEERAFTGDALVRLPPSLMASLVRLEWPGNVRQLNNVARQIVALGRVGRDPRSCAALARLLAPVPAARDEATPAVVPERAPSAAPRAATPGPEALAAVLERNHWKIDVTARELGISKTSLYARIARSPGLHTAGDISRAELLRCRARHGGDLKRMAEELRVSLRALQLRLRELRLSPADGA
ncbi:MAG: sigma-54-dependent Fis family transcriptional regulator [Myxococcales bacterium]|nr:sigma-54-dependent Fis family transcriptional regulator [Myxococcales bacterium]